RASYQREWLDERVAGNQGADHLQEPENGRRTARGGRDGGCDALLERIRVLVPQAAGVGRRRRQSVDFGPFREPGADRPRNAVGALRPAPAGQLRISTRFQTRRGGVTRPVFFWRVRRS